MSPLRDWPIKRKLTAILLLISGLVLVLTSAAFVTYQVVTFRRTIQSHLATRSRVLAANSTAALALDRKSTRLNSSHLVISYAVFCLKKKKSHRRSSAAKRATSTTP